MRRHQFQIQNIIFIVIVFSVANVIPSTKIVGGTETDIKNYPWQVSVVRAITGQHYCGGAIVGRATILTAANCIHLSEREILTDGDIRVRIGSTSRTNGRNLRTILRILVHRQFNGSTLQNNIAILTLTNFLDFTESIRSVSLPAINVQLETDEIVILTGYGEKWTREFAENLEAVQLQVVEQSVCKVAYEQSVMPAITDNMFCAGSAGNGLCEVNI